MTNIRKRFRNIRISSLIVVVGLLFAHGADGQLEPKPGEWIYHGHDLKNTKYSPLDQINRDNFDELEVAWRWTSISKDVTKVNENVRPSQFKPTPVVANGRMFVVTEVSQVVAIDPSTGAMLWSFDPESYKAGRPANLGWQHRGLSYWRDGDEERVLVATHDRKLWALDAETGKPISDFGDGGKVELEADLGRDGIQWRNITHTSPVGICRDTIIVGSIIFDGPTMKEMPPGHVRAFDVRTGKLKWVFHTIPQEGEFGVETWENDSWKYSGNTNVWSMFATDEELGYVYLPVSTPTNDMYGGHRPGNNLFAESLVCLDVNTGKRIWHFQAVHHGIWDYDFPTAPNLVDVTVDGKRVKAVAQVSKQAFLYVFDRETGKPLWPIEERPVEASTVPGEWTASTQPFPTKPAAYDQQGLTEDDLIDFTPELRAQALKIIDGYQKGPLFTPPNEKKGTIGAPSAGGGSNWQGAALDPETGILYVPSVSSLGYWRAVEPDRNRSNLRYVSSFLAGGGPDASPLQGLPLLKPPYTRVTAIDLNTGEHTWMTPHGDGPIEHPLIKDQNLPPLGALAGGNGPLLTKTLLFVTQGADARGTDNDNFPKITVFDKQTGEILGRIPLPSGSPNGNPITYMYEGRQYITIACGGGTFWGSPGKHPPELITLALPK